MPTEKFSISSRYYPSGDYRVSIDVDIPRDLVSGDREAINKAAYTMLQRFQLNTVILDPVAVAKRIQVRQAFEDCFRAAGLKPLTVTEIPNEYHRKYTAASHVSPWFHVETDLGLFKVGWRKHVISVEWNSLVLEGIRVRSGAGITIYDNCVHTEDYLALFDVLQNLKEQYDAGL